MNGEYAGKNVVAEIKRIKPYPAGDPVLSAINSLDIADKHKLIITTASVAL